MQWRVEALPSAWDEIRSMPPGLQARILRLMQIVETFGVDRLHEPHARQVDGKIWELRAKAAEGIARGLYVTMAGRRVVILHVFEKKTQKTPARAIALARQRMKEMDG
jgi:phage-related protein